MRTTGMSSGISLKNNNTYSILIYMEIKTALFTFSFCLALSVQAFDFKIGNLVFVTNEQGSSVSVMAEGVPFREENLTLLDSVVIPSSVTYSGKTYPVTSIGRGAFQYCTRMTCLTIPSSITSIAEQAFPNCRSLKQFIVPADHPKYTTSEGVLFTKEMDTLIAYPNSKTAAYFIPKEVKMIAKGAFQFCYDLSSVTIPEGVTTIGNNAFSSCHSLKEIVLPQSVRFVGDDAFSYCSNITTITIPSCITTYRESFFRGCKSLKQYVVPEDHPTFSVIEGVLYSKDKKMLVSFPKARPAKYVIKEGVEAIGDSAFYKCVHLTSLTLPSSLTSIGDKAFGSCFRLKDINCLGTKPPSLGRHIIDNSNSCIIYIPLSAESNYRSTIGWERLNIIEKGMDTNYSVTLSKAGTLLNTIGANNANKVYKLTINGPINGTDILTIRSKLPILRILDLKDATIVKGGDAYSENFYTSDNKIGESMFDQMQFLESVILPSHVTSIGWFSFRGCCRLVSITIPARVTSIGCYDFYGCEDLKEIHLLRAIPPKVIFDGPYAFKANPPQMTLAFERDGSNHVTEDNSVGFKGINTSTCTLFVPKGAKRAYQQTLWKVFQTIQE